MNSLHSSPAPSTGEEWGEFRLNTGTYTVISSFYISDIEYITCGFRLVSHIETIAYALIARILMLDTLPARLGARRASSPGIASFSLAIALNVSAS